MRDSREKREERRTNTVSGSILGIAACKTTRTRIIENRAEKREK